MPFTLPYPYPDLSTGVWDAYALLANLKAIAAIASTHAGNFVPSGAILMFQAGSTCPAGYTKVTDPALAGRYLRVNLSAAGGTGGSLTVTLTDPGHTHAISMVTASGGGHTHALSGPTSTQLVTSAAIGTTFTVASNTHLHVVTGGAHTHGVTGVTTSAMTGLSGTIAPTYLDIILCQKS